MEKGHYNAQTSKLHKDLNQYLSKKERFCQRLFG